MFLVAKGWVDATSESPRGRGGERERESERKGEMVAAVVETTCVNVRHQVSERETPKEQLLHRNVQRFRGGLVFKAHRLRVSLNSRLESNKEEEEDNK